MSEPKCPGEEAHTPPAVACAESQADSRAAEFNERVQNNADLERANLVSKLKRESKEGGENGVVAGALDGFAGPRTLAELFGWAKLVDPEGNRSHHAQLDAVKRWGRVRSTPNTMQHETLETSADSVPIGNTILSVADATIAAQLLRANPPKHPFYSIFGGGVFVECDPAEWKRQRDLLRPAFSMKQLAKLLPLMLRELRHTEAQFAADPRGELTTARQKMAQLTMSIICQASCGICETEMRRRAPAISDAITALSEDNFAAMRTRSLARALRHDPEKRRKFTERQAAAGEVVGAFMADVVAGMQHLHQEGVRHGEDSRDGQGNAGSSENACSFASDPRSLCGVLWGAAPDITSPDAIDDGRTTASTSESEWDDCAVDNFGIVLFAGHITTANSLTFMLYELARAPQLQDRARAAVDQWYAQLRQRVAQDHAQSVGSAGLGSDEALERFVTMRSLKQLPLINGIVLETLRKWPPVANGTLRVLDADTVIAGRRVPRGTPVSTPIYALHHDPEYWPDPNTFDPTRKGLRLGNKHFMPFLQGPRNCLGMNVALLEMRLAAIRFLRRFKLSLVPRDFEAAGTNLITLGPDDGLPLVLVPREGPTAGSKL